MTQQHDVDEQDRLRKDYEQSTTKKRAEGDGVVTTPVEIVDFINRAVTEILHDKWGMSPGDANVFIEDPFAGTGIFGARLLTNCPEDDVTAIAAQLNCIEVDQDAADIAEHNLRRIIYRRGGTPPLDRRLVRCADTFTIDPHERGEPA